MKTLHKIYHKKNELFEIEFFEDKECTKTFEFEGKENVYLELKEGDMTPLIQMCAKTQHYGSDVLNVCTPYLNTNLDFNGITNDFVFIQTLDDITPNFSKYIPEDNVVLFLSDNDLLSFGKLFLNNRKYLKSRYIGGVLNELNKGKFILNNSGILIFIPQLTSQNIDEINNVAEELKAKYGVEKVNVFALHCFMSYFNGNTLVAPNNDFYSHELDKIISTNSTGMLGVRDGNFLQVIDCYDIFNEKLNEGV